MASRANHSLFASSVPRVAVGGFRANNCFRGSFEGAFSAAITAGFDGPIGVGSVGIVNVPSFLSSGTQRNSISRAGVAIVLALNNACDCDRSAEGDRSIPNSGLGTHAGIG